MSSLRPVTITLPWCEADLDAYVDGIANALRLDAARTARVEAIMRTDRVTLSMRVFPAHYTACMLPDAYEAAARAISHSFDVEVVELPGHMGRPTDRPRIQITIAAA